MSISSVSGFLSTASLFSRIDGNADGKVTKDEFISAKPADLSESQASALFDSIDSSGSGSITESQLESGLSNSRDSGSYASLQGNLSSDMLAALFQMLESGSGTSGTSSSDMASDSDTALSAEERFNAMDTDGDGSVSKAEFLAAKPDDVSDAQAEALYNSIDTDGTGSITLAQYEQSISQGGGAPPPPSSVSSDDGASASYNALDANQDGSVSLEEFLAAKPEDVSSDMATNLFNNLDSDASRGLSLDEYAASEVEKSNQIAGASTTTDTDHVQELTYLRQLLQAVSAYDASTYSSNQQSNSLLASA